MDAVRTFNNELSSIYECKPPISRAKMTSVTKSAIKAIKFYKHVVQSVEKFIQKCRPEYKIPGLYVIDSIVRQSRHQFGAEKDVFAPRFAKNVTATFQHLFKCPPDDKAKVVRVLNLWQKNGVFSAEIIQPLLDMANPELAVAVAGQNAEATAKEETTPPKQEGTGWSGWSDTDSQPAKTETTPPTMASLQQLIQQTQEAQHQQQQTLQQLQELQQQIQKQAHPSPKPPQLDNSFMAQIQALSASLAVATAAAVKKPGGATGTQQSDEKTSGFNKALLDFDYGDEDEDHHDKTDKKPSPATETLPPVGVSSTTAPPSFPNVELIQQLTQSLKKGEAAPSLQEQLKQRLLLQQEQQKHLQQFQQTFNQSLPLQEMGHMHQKSEPMDLEEDAIRTGSNEDDSISWRKESDDDRLEDRRRRSRSPRRFRSRSRSRSRSPRRRRRRSRSRSRSRSRRKRTRSRSRSRSPRHKERRKEREREKERQKKGLPPIKTKHLTVCSTTIWLGHLTKTTSEKDIKDTFEEYGPIQSIDMIPPRGCAFVCMVHRQDAYRALQKLKNVKIHGNLIKMTWATNKGTKGNTYKKYWEVDLGVMYIPWDKLPKQVDLGSLSEGGMIDKETLPPELRKAEDGEGEEKKDLAKMTQDDLIAMAAAQAGDAAAASQQGTPITDQGTPSQTPGSTPLQTTPQTPQNMTGLPPNLPAGGMLVRPPGYPSNLPFPPFPGFNPSVPPPPYHGMPGFPRPPMGVPPPGMLGQMPPGPVPPVGQTQTQPQDNNRKNGSDAEKIDSKIGFPGQGDSSSTSQQDSNKIAKMTQLHLTQQQIASHIGKPGAGDQPGMIQPKLTMPSDFAGLQGQQKGPVTSIAATPMQGQGQRMPFMQGMMNQLGVRMVIGMAAMRQNQMNQGVGPTSQMPSAVTSTPTTVQDMQSGLRLPLLPSPGPGGIMNRPVLATTTAGGQIPTLMSINIRGGQSQVNPQALPHMPGMIPGQLPPGAIRPGMIVPGMAPRMPGVGVTPSMGQGDQQSVLGSKPGLPQGTVQYPLPGLRGATANISAGVTGTGQPSDGPGVSQVLSSHFNNRDRFSAARDVDERRLSSSDDSDFKQNEFQDRFNRSETKRGFNQDRPDRWGPQVEERAPNRGIFNEKWNTADRERDRERGFDAASSSFDRGVRDGRGRGMTDRREWRDRGFDRHERGDWRENRLPDRREKDWDRGRDRDRDRDNSRDRDRENPRDRDRDRNRDYERNWDRDNRRRDWHREDRDRRGGDREFHDQRDRVRSRFDSDNSENENKRGRFDVDNQEPDNKQGADQPAQPSESRIEESTTEKRDEVSKEEESNVELKLPDRPKDTEETAEKGAIGTTEQDAVTTQKEESAPVVDAGNDARDNTKYDQSIAPPSDQVVETPPVVNNHTSAVHQKIELNDSQGNETACETTATQEHKSDDAKQQPQFDSTDATTESNAKAMENAEPEKPTEQASA